MLRKHSLPWEAGVSCVEFFNIEGAVLQANDKQPDEEVYENGIYEDQQSAERILPQEAHC